MTCLTVIKHRICIGIIFVFKSYAVTVQMNKVFNVRISSRFAMYLIFKVPKFMGYDFILQRNMTVNSFTKFLLMLDVRKEITTKVNN